MKDACDNCERPFTEADDGKVLIYEFVSKGLPPVSLCDRCFQRLSGLNRNSAEKEEGGG